MDDNDDLSRDHEDPSLPYLLGLAVERNDLAEVKSLLEQGADPNGDALTPAHVVLSHAAHLGYLEMVELLLAAGASPNRVAPLLEVPLCVAAESGYADICAALLRRGADVNGRDNDESTALHRAASRGRIDICKSLIAAGADVSLVDGFNHTPLHDAALVRKSHAIELCDLLLAAGASSSFIPENPDPRYLTAFQSAVSYGRRHTSIHFLEKCGEDPAQSTLMEKTLVSISTNGLVTQALLAAITERSIAKDTLALRPELDPHQPAKTSKGYSPL
jgi:ankyrin repeat protein